MFVLGHPVISCALEDLILLKVVCGMNRVQKGEKKTTKLQAGRTSKLLM